VLIALSVILAIGGVIGSQVAQVANNIPQYVTTVEKKVEVIRAYTVGRIETIVGNIGRQAPGTADVQGPKPSPSRPVASVPTGQKAPVPDASSTESSPLAIAERYLSPLLSPLATLGIVFVVSVFALLQREDLRDRFIRLLGATDLHRTTMAMDDAGRRLSRYFLTQLGINASFGIIIGIGLFYIGVPNPVLWAILSALLRFVPAAKRLNQFSTVIAQGFHLSPSWFLQSFGAGSGGPSVSFCQCR
jgi:predicted PurR-regulated permease PerM